MNDESPKRVVLYTDEGTTVARKMEYQLSSQCSGCNNADFTLTGWLSHEKTFEGGDQIFAYTGGCDSCADDCLDNSADSSRAAIYFNLNIEPDLILIESFLV